MVATMLGSLIVQARAHHARRGGRRPARSRRRSGRPSSALLPAALVGQPQRRREVVERDDRVDARLQQRLALAGVVVEGGRGELAVLGLDAAPLQREAVVGEARARRAGRRPRASGSSCRSSRRSTPCSPTRACAPTATSRCSSCRPRSGGRRWRCPSGTRRGRCERSTWGGTVPRPRVREDERHVAGGRRRAREAARPRADRGQHLPGRLARRGAPAGVRRPGGRPGPGGRGPHGRAGPVASTRSTPTSCARATRTCRSSTRSTASATAARSPPAAWWPSSTARPSSTCSPASRCPRTGLEHQAPMPDVARPGGRCPTSPTRMAPYKEALGRLVPPAPPDRHALRRLEPARPQASRCRRTSGCGCGPTARCPTTRCCTPACSPTRAT